MKIREARSSDLDGLLQLYTQLHENPVPKSKDSLLTLWDRILRDKQHHIIVGVENGIIVSSCVIIIIPNLTHNQQPYGLVENVITDEAHRRNGYASAVLNYAKELALSEHCYKIMLLTGSKEKHTLNFYKKSRYNSDDRTAFIQWL